MAVEVFEGNTGDPKTVAAQVNKLRERFHLERLVLIGDRGMPTQKRVEEDLRPHAGLEWISALRAPQIQKLAAGGLLQMSLFDERDLAEGTHPDYPGERLIVCRNPLLAAERVRKRGELMEAAEKKLKQIEAATQRKRQPVRSAEKISYLVGKALAATKSRSTSAGRSPRRDCGGNATRSASSKTRPWMGSTSCAHRFPPSGSIAIKRCWPTSVWQRWSGPFDV